MSLRPCHFSGKGRSVFASISHAAASSVSSPRLVVNSLPQTAITSPTSAVVVKSENALVPILSSPIKTCSLLFAEPSKMSKNIDPPCSRFAMILPAMPTIFFVRAYVLNFFLTSPISMTEKEIFSGYGLMPLFLSVSSFFIRCNRISSPGVIHACLLDDIDDFISDDAFGCLHFHDFSFFVSQKRRSQRRFVGNFIVDRRGFFISYDAERHFPWFLHHFDHYF